MKIAQKYFNRGNSKVSLKDYTGAIVNYDKGIEINPKFAKAYYRRGIAKNLFHDGEGSILNFNKTIEIDPENAVSFSLKDPAKVYRLNNSLHAISDFDKAIQINPGFAQAYFSRGLAKNYFYDYATIISDVNWSDEKSAESASSFENEGFNSSYELKDFEEIISDFDKAIEIDPFYAEAYYSRGLAKNCQQKHTEAVINYIETKESALTDITTIDDDPARYNNFMDCARAIADFDKAIKIDPEYAEAYYCRGLAKNYFLDYAGSITDFGKAIEMDPESKKAFENGDIGTNYQLEDYAGAIADFDMAIKINPKHSKAYYSRGLIKIYFQDQLETIFAVPNDKTEKTASEQVPDNVEEPINFLSKNYMGAIADFDKALEINPRFAKAYYYRGLAKIYYQNNIGAMNDFNEAIAIDPRYAEAFHKRGLLKIEIKQTESGYLDLKKAAELGYREA